MPRLLIRHVTHYTYERPVSFGPHRLLLRPRDSHAVRIVDARLTLSPPGDTRWLYDALGNCVCHYTPQGSAAELAITSELVIERYPAPLSPLELGNPNTASPIVYRPEDRAILAPYIEPATHDESGVLLDWLRGHMGWTYEPVLDFLLRFNQQIHNEITYVTRHEEGVQSPAQTLAFRSGTCRDFAWLMVEALRRQGYAARFVTGYLYSPHHEAMRGAGATHAWCEVFLPVLGWLEFDPTNGMAESSALIPVAVTRTPREAAPVSGTILGDPGNSDLFVGVDVRQAESALEPA
ncbi:MAG: transglutaminase family protein [Caulobacteraceae bacterium]